MTRGVCVCVDENKMWLHGNKELRHASASTFGVVPLDISLNECHDILNLIVAYTPTLSISKLLAPKECTI